MKQETLQLTGGSGKNKRRELDYYPTPKNVTQALMDFMFKNDYMDFNTTIWEPACGNGAMSEALMEYCPSVYSSDIRETGYGVGNIDFLKEKHPMKFDAIITNPPFNLSAEFIKKATSESRIVCMLLKSQYWHAKNRYNLFVNTPPRFVLPLTWRPDFLEHEKQEGDKKGAPTMEVAWSVWFKGSNETIYLPLQKPEITKQSKKSNKLF